MTITTHDLLEQRKSLNETTPNLIDDNYGLNTEVEFPSDSSAADFYSGAKKKYNTIVGLDEVGRGPGAGPTVVCCVILPKNHGIKGLKDSKKISHKQREILAKEIKEKSLDFQLGISDNSIIDMYGIREAVHLAGIEALSKLTVPPDFLLCDGNLNFSGRIGFPYLSVIRGDGFFDVVSAASIVAKVEHDKIMLEYHDLYPEYHWNKNNGYLTKDHLEAIHQYGITPLHRKSFGICRTAKLRER